MKMAILYRMKKQKSAFLPVGKSSQTMMNALSLLKNK